MLDVKLYHWIIIFKQSMSMGRYMTRYQFLFLWVNVIYVGRGLQTW